MTDNRASCLAESGIPVPNVIAVLDASVVVTANSGFTGICGFFISLKGRSTVESLVVVLYPFIYRASNFSTSGSIVRGAAVGISVFDLVGDVSDVWASELSVGCVVGRNAAEGYVVSVLVG